MKTIIVQDRRREENDPGKAAQTLRTIARVIEVLEHLAEYPEGLTISEMAELLGMPISSGHVLIRRLTEMDCLRRRPGERRFQTGPRMVRFAIRVAGSMEVIAVARPFITDLAKKTHEDVYLALVEDQSVIYADRATGTQSLRLDFALGQPRALHATAVGKLYLAMLQESEARARLRRLKFQRFTRKTLTDASSLDRALRSIRRLGYAITEDEHIDGVSAVAAPIRGSVGQFLGAVALPLPRKRFKEHGRALVREVLSTAERISEQLGWQNAAGSSRLRVNGRR